MSTKLTKKLAEGYFSRMAVDKSDDEYTKSKRAIATKQLDQYKTKNTKPVSKDDWKGGSQPALKKEETISELSKKTLGSYIKKASGTSHEKSSPNLASRGAYEHGLDPDFNSNAGEKYDRAAVKRSKKIAKAVDKITKEAVESLDDLKPILESPAYSKAAVDKAIAAASRKGKVPKGEEKLIHRLLKGRHSFRGDNGKIVKESLAGPGHPQLKKLKKQYDRNEDNNDHSTNAVLLAKHFGTDQEHETAKKHLANRDRLGHGSEEGSKFQYDMSKKYYKRLTAGPLKIKEAFSRARNDATMKWISTQQKKGNDHPDTKAAKASQEAVMKSEKEKNDARRTKKIVKEATKSPTHIVIHSNGKRIGSMSAQDFMKHSGAPKHTFVQTAVQMFNKYKEKIGEPERASHELQKEEIIFEAGKKTKSAKTEMKRKYLGKSRGTTITGKPAHEIITKPMLNFEKQK